jgi:hypothetical protein
MQSNAHDGSSSSSRGGMQDNINNNNDNDYGDRGTRIINIGIHNNANINANINVDDKPRCG